MLVVDHLIAAQEEPHGQRQQQEHRGAAQEARFQAALQPEEAGIDFARLAQVGEAVAQLPGARRHPVEQDAEDHQRQHVAAQQVVERQIEEIERERLLKYGVMPAGSRGTDAACAGEAHHRPGVDGGSRHEIAEQQQHQQRDAGVQPVLAQVGAGEVQRARMRDPEREKGHQRGRRQRGDTVIEHAEPGAQLPHFLPPVDLDGVGGRRTQPHQKQDGDGDQCNAQHRRAGGPLAPLNFIPHAPSVPPRGKEAFAGGPRQGFLTAEAPRRRVLRSPVSTLSTTLGASPEP